MRAEPFLPQDTMHRSEITSELKNNELNKAVADQAAEVKKNEQENEEKQSQVAQSNEGDEVHPDGKQGQQKKESQKRSPTNNNDQEESGRARRLFGGQFFDEIG